jgi:hypothetical protein
MQHVCVDSSAASASGKGVIALEPHITCGTGTCSVSTVRFVFTGRHCMMEKDGDECMCMCTCTCTCNLKTTCALTG